MLCMLEAYQDHPQNGIWDYEHVASTNGIDTSGAMLSITTNQFYLIWYYRKPENNISVNQFLLLNDLKSTLRSSTDLLYCKRPIMVFLQFSQA